MAKMIEASERDDAERVIRAAGMNPEDFAYTRSDTYPQQGVGQLIREVTVHKGTKMVSFDGARWVIDFEKALKEGAFD